MGASDEQRLARWVPAAIGLALALGTALGLVLAWHVWPVRWYNTDPSDLRVEHQMEYVLTAADSLAITADVDVARQRMAQLVDEDTTWAQVANLVANVAQAREREGDAAGAVRVRQLARLTGLPEGTSDRFDAPKRNIAIAVSRLGVVLLVALAIIGVITLVARFWRRRGAPVEAPDAEPDATKPEPPACEPRPEPEYEDDAPYAAPLSERETTVLTAEARRPYTETPAQPQDDEDEDLPEQQEVEEAAEEREEPEAKREVTAVHLPIALTKRRPAAESEGAGGMVRLQRRGALGTFEAEYTFGQDDFDCSFSIESSDGDFYGECGIGVANVLSGDGVQKVDAFELWLFDKGDIRTVSKVLVTPNADRDAGLRPTLEAKGEVVPAELGLAVLLETQAMRVTATIVECQFADDGARADAYFTALTVGLLVDRGEGEAE